MVFLPPFQLPEDFWDELVECIRRAYRPFSVEVTDVDPGTATHLEHVIAGEPEDIGAPINAGGISPFNCGYFRNSTSFAFAGLFGTDPSPSALALLCTFAVHEIGHQHGLDHHAYLPDVMTYHLGCEPKRLIARDVACGPINPEPCLCGGTMENSYDVVRAVHGASEVLFGDGFEIVEPGFDCAWSGHVSPPPLQPLATAAPGLACGTLEPSNPGLHPSLRAGAAARDP
jgi:hypothetical protein